MKITFLGTNGWYATKTGNTICTLIESEKYYIVFDAGDGIYKLDKYIKKDKPIYLFLSHLHLDHIYGFHILPKFKFRNKFTIFLDKEKIKYLREIIHPPYAMSLKKIFCKPKLKSISKDHISMQFPVEYKKLFHENGSLGFRIELDGRILVYCCDTGICKNSLLLSKKADILIHECSAKSGTPFGRWGHTNPEEAADLAKRAGVKKLILTHFGSSEFLSLKDRQTAQKNAQKIFKNTIGAKDGMIIKV